MGAGVQVRSARLAVKLGPARVLGLLWILVTAGIPVGSLAQTTEGLISGQVRNADTGQPLGNAAVRVESLATNTRRTELTGGAGFYNIPLLPPGTYRLVVQSPGGAVPMLVQNDVPIGPVFPSPSGAFLDPSIAD